MAQSNRETMRTMEQAKDVPGVRIPDEMVDEMLAALERPVAYGAVYPVMSYCPGCGAPPRWCPRPQ